jgi:hypothetical protein
MDIIAVIVASAAASAAIVGIAISVTSAVEASLKLYQFREKD